ncbi:Gamma-glutamylputrescine synthetase PuuA [Sinobacterium norvegicum]|uniref:Gamma-glutamylputrescine synthetase PuuA n=1 Tax=Sinobacterium norvegicum TaxID=1641715 RepID=A0ABM9AGI7_9GAMM|nr:glutamine synthetase family protein [Sinobacterium norvegicum]CAH0992330.1 Gamma-glutamylputrescine synthetase PuuA [Sinobacterium norvegicum]
MTANSSAVLTQFLADHPDIEVFEVILIDVSGGLRGKWIQRENIAKVCEGGLKLPLSTLLFDVWGRDPEACVFDSGDEDGIAVPELRSISVVSWMKRPTAQLLISLLDTDNTPCKYDPRNIVSGLMARFKQQGLTPMLASEMEFNLFKPERDGQGVPQHTQGNATTVAMQAGQTYGIDDMQEMAEFMHAVRDVCAEQNLPIDTLIKEAGPSQYEINLYHQADALLAADQAVLLQRAIKGVAKKHGYRASFMAKPFGDQAGNGMHVHCSLLDDDGNNAFDDGSAEGNELLQHAVAGCLALMEESMLLFAPNVNSYRRFQRGSHAPLAPTWGYENRTCAVRIPAGSTKAMRIEHRVGGADANPYLSIAAILAGMLYGIENKLAAPTAMVGNAYDQQPPTLARYLPDAIECFQRSTVLPQYFGAVFHRNFTEIKRQELAEFDKQVTSLEYDSYL